jgi:uncharacterized protein YeaC (DUF1315 family)
MKKKEKTIKMRKIGNYLELNGVWYFPKQHSSIDSGKSIIFKEVDKNTVKGNIGFLVKTLKPYLDKGMILEDALSELKPFQLDKLSQAINLGKKPKVKKRYGCVQLEINGTTIDIR